MAWSFCQRIERERERDFFGSVHMIGDLDGRLHFIP